MDRRGRTRGYHRGGHHQSSSTRSYTPKRLGMVRSHIDVPENKMGLVIGKEGSRIQQISTKTGARLFTKREIRDRVFIEAETEEAVERAKQEVSRIVSTGIRKSTAAEMRTLAIDPGGLGDDDQVCLKRTKIPGRDDKYFRLVPASSPAGRTGWDEDEGKEHIGDLLRNAEKILCEIREESDKRPVRSPLEVDLWVHLGHLLIKDVDDREAALPSSVQTILSKVNKDRNWRSCFEAGVVALDVVYMHELLKNDAVRVQSSVRHDIGFYTPSGQDRRLKVWILEEGTEDAGSQQVLGVHTGNETSRDIGSALVRAGPGILCTPLTPRLKADVAMPGRHFDCRLLIRTGIRDSSELGVKEKREDAILIGEFCEKVRINGKDLLYPRSGFADGYRMHFKRKSERISYSYNGFELTTSREKSTRYDGVDCPQEQCKVDLHVRSSKCERLLDRREERDWRPRDIVTLIPGIFKFVKEDLDFLVNE